MTEADKPAQPEILELPPLPPMPPGIVKHPKLGDLFDRLGLQLYAVKYAFAVHHPAGFTPVPTVATVAMLRPFYECPPNELPLAWDAAMAAANVELRKAREVAAGEAVDTENLVVMLAQDAKRLHADLQRLQGEADVRVRLLVECDKVLSTLECESTEEAARLGALRDAVLAATLPHRAAEADLLSARENLKGTGP